MPAEGTLDNRSLIVQSLLEKNYKDLLEEGSVQGS